MTREEAIKICIREKDCVQSALDACADGGHYVSPDGIITAADYVEAMGMAISALREQPRWISVKERLPEKYKFVLCYKDGKTRIGYYIGAEYVKGVAAFADYHNHSFTVTHWMPLPEPPEVKV